MFNLMRKKFIQFPIMKSFLLCFNKVFGQLFEVVTDEGMYIDFESTHNISVYHEEHFSKARTMSLGSLKNV